MRIAAGILLMIIGMVSLTTDVVVLSEYGITYDFGFDLFMIIAAVFIITGGVFCLREKYGGLCLASALVAALLGIVSLTGNPSTSNWLAWSYTLGGIISTIFICIRKSEWSESQA
jgi:hypothetical protein